MHNNSKLSYLPIRSLGDFIITATVIKNNIDGKVPITIPNYLEGLYNAVGGDNYFTVVDEIVMGNQPAFFELYKIKDLKNIKRLLTDLTKFFNLLKRDTTYLLDFRSRRIQYTGIKFKWPAPGRNIYQSKEEFFKGYFKAKESKENLIKIAEKETTHNVIIFPESRIKDKEIPDSLIDKVLQEYPDVKINVARFSTSTSSKYNYGDFNQLISLIKEASMIISSDSLPYHIANFYDIPHYVVYQAKTKFYTEHFRTPYMIQHKYYSLISSDDYREVIDKLAVIFNKKATDKSNI